jgi:hypothetical protein
MHWPIDAQTQAAARDFPLPLPAVPAPQEVGRGFDLARWLEQLRPGVDQFPPRPAGGYRANPDSIIAEFRAGHFLPGLALTASWGTMARTKRKIYGTERLQKMHDTLEQCAESIGATESIQASWDLLVQNLEWTSVMTSKTLHFLCRALGHDNDPPVPIDGKVVREKVWPKFRNGIRQLPLPGNWNGHGFEAYCRYMTAILQWAHARNWTTTQVECTIWNEIQLGALNKQSTLTY